MTATQIEKANRCKALHQGPGAFVIANAWDAGSARILAGLGFLTLATAKGVTNMRIYLISIVLILILSFFAPFLTLAQEKTAKATFAGGCYWCVEEVYDELKGVISATSGFAAPRVEAVEIMYKPDKISFEKLLDLFWKNIDPTDSQGQFCDRGAQYTSAIFYHHEQQKTEAEKSKAAIETILKQKVVTPILPAAKFTPVVASQQDFYKKNKQQYKQYKTQCGRERRLRELWGGVQSLKTNEDR